MRQSGCLTRSEGYIVTNFFLVKYNILFVKYNKFGSNTSFSTYEVFSQDKLVMKQSSTKKEKKLQKTEEWLQKPKYLISHSGILMMF